MGNDFEVMINDEERKKNFMKVFGTNIVKVKSPVPKRILKPDGVEADAYFLDLILITAGQRENLIQDLSERFQQPIEFVRKNLDKIGVPILADHCTLIINNPQRWF